MYPSLHLHSPQLHSPWEARNETDVLVGTFFPDGFTACSTFEGDTTKMKKRDAWIQFDYTWRNKQKKNTKIFAVVEQDFSSAMRDG
jgi:hypothetical protein